MQEIQITVDGLSGAHCSRAVESALKQSSGVEDVSVDSYTGIAFVVFDPRKVIPLDLAFTIKSNGFKILNMSKPVETLTK